MADKFEGETSEELHGALSQAHAFAQAGHAEAASEICAGAAAKETFFWARLTGEQNWTPDGTYAYRSNILEAAQLLMHPERVEEGKIMLSTLPQTLLKGVE